ncbi:MAG: hypothetical protein K2G75_03775 [Muribaculaceae bacterium]|nr:hypothetical protein [Muribaculaceae bacterium]MDE5924423.1 hypothetical protein [Muribaculaceae bacterium]
MPKRLASFIGVEASGSLAGAAGLSEVKKKLEETEEAEKKQRRTEMNLEKEQKKSRA